jgi:hypothetical protein
MQSVNTPWHETLRLAGVAVLVLVGNLAPLGVRSAEKVPSGDPCTVVPLADVQKAFPGAKAGVRNNGKEKYGLTECEWQDGEGQVVFGVQEFYGKDTAMAETKSFALAVTGGNLAQTRNVRYEILTGVGLGNEAVAFVEATDAKRGIVSGSAMLTLHRGERTLWLTSPRLPVRDRAAALKTLETLGKIAVKRLD